MKLRNIWVRLHERDARRSAALIRRLRDQIRLLNQIIVDQETTLHSLIMRSDSSLEMGLVDESENTQNGLNG